jgi:hypothetical protein
MGDVLIPGDELEQLASVLPRIKDLLASADRADGGIGQQAHVSNPRVAAVVDGAGDPVDLGSSELTAAIANFHTRWSDGHYQLGKEVQNLHDAAQNIVDQFDQLDQDLTDELEGKTPPGQGQQLPDHIPGAQGPRNEKGLM